MEIYISVVIPAYNEAARLPRAAREIAAHLQKIGKNFEIIVVNDGSTDDTARVAQELSRDFPMLKLISLNPNQGKGGAVKTGMLAASGSLVLFTDADQSTPIDQLDKLLPKIEREGFDIAFGSRAARGAEVEQSQAWHRMLAGKIFGKISTALLIRGIKDTQCGFKLMTREAAQKIFPRVTSRTAIFDLEMFVLAARENLRCAEVPVRWVHDPDTRIPYNVRRALRIFAEVFRIRRAQNVFWPVKVRK
jgi:dolichyl-phosphate beta-glucosyltransferase